MLGEGFESAAVELGESFETSGGGECPARSTLSLVLDGGDCALGNPVDIISSHLINGVDEEIAGWYHEPEIVLCELILSQAGELVDSHIVGSEFVGVVGLDFGQVFEEYSLSVCFLEHGVVFDAMLELPGLEL